MCADKCDHNSKMYFQNPRTYELHDILQDFPIIREMLKFFPTIHKAKCYKSTLYDNYYCLSCSLKHNVNIQDKSTSQIHYLVCQTPPPSACSGCNRECYSILPIFQCEKCFFTYVDYVVKFYERDDTLRNWDGNVPTIPH